MPISLITKIATLTLPNPTILSAGILGLTAKSLQAASHAGAGAVTTKSIGLEPRSGYPNPTIVSLRYGVLNAMGLPNPGAVNYLKELQVAKQESEGIIIVASVYGATPKEYAETAKILAKGGADAIELNLSCPNVKQTGLEVGQDPKFVEETVRQTRSEVSVPVFAKLSPNVTDIAGIAKAAERAGASAVVAINTVRAMSIDIETQKPILSNRIGGLSGPAIKPIALRCIYELYKAVDIPIIGCGGITNYRDAVEFHLAGARAIQIGTAVSNHGLKVFREVTHGIERYLHRKGYRKVGEIVGLSHRA